MRWITREDVTVESSACTWLIKHFIDPEAEILHAPCEEVSTLALKNAATVYGIPSMRMKSGINKCDFESLIIEHKLDSDIGLNYLVEVVNIAISVPVIEECSGVKILRKAQILQTITIFLSSIAGLEMGDRVEIDDRVYSVIYSLSKTT